MSVFRSIGLAASALVGTSAMDRHPTVTCKVELGWNPENNFKSPFDMYRIEVRASDNSFKPVIGKIFNHPNPGNYDVEALVPMYTFLNKPFSLKDGDDIIVRSSALMSKSADDNHNSGSYWGPYTQVNHKSKAKVASPPSRFASFGTGSMTRHSIALTWKQAHSNKVSTKIEILRANSPDDVYVKVASQDASINGFTVDNIQDGRSYLYKLRATNGCGYTESDPITVDMSVAPFTGSGAISLSGCNAKVNWRSSSKGDFSSEVEIKDHAGNWQNVNVCGAQNTNECTFHMSTLENAPFNLAQGTVFEGRVRTCTVGRCSGWENLSNTNALITTPPSSVDESLFESLVWANQYNPPVNDVQLSWFNFQQQYDQSDELNFRLDMCQGDSCGPNSKSWKTVKYTQDHKETVAWTSGVEKNWFRVTACNSCGCSKSCKPLEVRKVQPPSACGCPIVKSTQCTFNTPHSMTSIDWTRPSSDGGAPIQAYKLEVLSTHGSWIDLSSHCTNTKLARTMTCSFKQETLSGDAFAIHAGHEILSRVSALNQAGWSRAARSDKCSNNHSPVLALKTPPTLPKPVVTQGIHSSFSVCWKQCHACAGYQLAWNAKTHQRFVKNIDQSEAGCHIISNLVPGTVYDICVRSDDQCGESCIEKRMNPPPTAPVCTVGICDPITVKCASEQAGDDPVREYNIEVKSAKTNKWIPYRSCGLENAETLSCEISHKWLSGEAHYVEGQTVMFRVAAYNKYGWGATSKLLTTKFLSKPTTASAINTSADRRSISWNHCGAGDCTYSVTVLAPLPVRQVATNIKELSYTLPSHFANDVYQYKVHGENVCGTTNSCTPYSHSPIVSGKCPMQLTVKPLFDECEGSEKRVCKNTFVQVKDNAGAWQTVKSCVFNSLHLNDDGVYTCAVDEKSIMDQFGLSAGTTVTTRTVVECEGLASVYSKESSLPLANPMKAHVQQPAMRFDENQMCMNWEDENVDLWCSNTAVDNGAMKLIPTYGRKNHCMHAQCGVSYLCKLSKANSCWLDDSWSANTVLTHPCLKPFVPKCDMKYVCLNTPLGLNRRDYVHVTCSSPPIGSSVIIDEYKFELMTGFKYADNTNIWAEYSCPADGSTRNPPACMIPMEKLARHPYGLKDNAVIKGRVTAAPSYGPPVTAACQSSSVDGSPILQNQAPYPISLTTTQTSDEVEVCWNNPFAADKDSNTIELHWTNDPMAKGSVDKKFYTESEFVQDITNSCLSIQIRDGWTTLMAIASNGCNSVSTTISIQLTDCPTCHHPEELVIVEPVVVPTPAPAPVVPKPTGHHGKTTHHASGAPAVSTTVVDDAAANVVVDDAAKVTETVVVVVKEEESASADKWSTISMNGSTTGLCRVPRQVEKPVVTMGNDYNAVIAWDSSNSMQSAEFSVTYQVAWDKGSFWEDDARLDVTSAKTSPFVWADLKPLMTYRFAVRAVNDCGAGPFSQSTSLTV